jgi:hypothetical protein
MKNFLLAALVLSSLLFTSCRKDLDGAGSVITKVVDFQQPIHSLESRSSFNIRLVQVRNVADERVEITGYENLVDYAIARMSGNALVLERTDRFDISRNDLRLTVYTANLDEIIVEGSGDITTDGYYDFGSTLEIFGNGSGDLYVNGYARNVAISANGSGDIELGGECNLLDIRSTGSGNIRAFRFEADEVDVRSTGSGNIEVDAFLFLDANISGSGSVFYEGNPAVRSVISGTGSLVRR